MKKYKNLKEFYPYYLTEHADKTTKLFHFIGTAFSILFFMNPKSFEQININKEIVGNKGKMLTENLEV